MLQLPRVGGSSSPVKTEPPQIVLLLLWLWLCLWLLRVVACFCGGCGADARLMTCVFPYAIVCTYLGRQNTRDSDSRRPRHPETLITNQQEANES